MGVSITPLGADFAGEVSGVDCRKPLDAETVAAIEAGMDRYAVLVFHDQHFQDDEQVAFTLQFGEIEKKGHGSGLGNIHFRTEAQARTLGQGIGDFSNVDGFGNPLPSESRAYQFKLADRLWHSDSSFRAIPARYSMLSARSVPSWGGNTEFADMRAAYDALDPRMKAEAEGLICHHSQMYSREAVGFREMSDAERDAFRPVRQSLVRTHPVTGRKSLFLSAHAGLIEGWSIPESRMYLRDLVEFATQPRFVHSHQWRVGDFVIWDNRCTMHRARRFDWNEPRDVRQTRLAGDVATAEQVA